MIGAVTICVIYHASEFFLYTYLTLSSNRQETGSRKNNFEKIITPGVIIHLYWPPTARLCFCDQKTIELVSAVAFAFLGVKQAYKMTNPLTTHFFPFHRGFHVHLNIFFYSNPNPRVLSLGIVWLLTKRRFKTFVYCIFLTDLPCK